MALTLHQGATFAVSESSGDIRSDSEQGYYHLDTRFLSRRVLRLDGQPTLLQDASSPDWPEGFCFVTNPTLAKAARATIGVVVHRVVAEGLYEDIDVENFGDGDASFSLELELGADFAYILTVKHKAMAGTADWSPKVKVEQLSPERLRFALEGVGEPHETTVSFNRPMDGFSDGRACFDVKLGRRERLHLHMVVTARLGAEATPAQPAFTGSGAGRRAQRRQELDRATCSLESDHRVLSRAFTQATHDLASLRIKAEDRSSGDPNAFAIAAGIPWYMDLFGRDSLIASYQTMFADPSLARGTLEALARLQGTKLIT